MKKRVVDLTVDELEALASEAWNAAAADALAKGAPVVGREGDQIVKTYPDGRVEVLKQAKPLIQAGAGKPSHAGRKRRTA